jgi:hypothetical protein
MILAVICLILPCIPAVAETISAGSTVTGTLLPAETTTVVTSSNNPSVFGQPVMFTATVSPIIGIGTPTGTVQFAVDGSNFGLPVTLSGGEATSTATDTLAVGNHTVTAVYSGDSSYITSTGVLSGGQTVNKGLDKTNTYLGAINNPSIYGEQVTFYVLVTSGWCMAFPSGTVTFMEGSTVLGTRMLNQWGVTSFTTSSLSAGKHVITAVYNGDSNFDGSTSNPWMQWVFYETTTNLTSTSNPSTYGQSVAFTATVKVKSPGTINPNSGTVTFYDGSYNIGTVSLSGNNTAVLNYISLTAGSHSIKAVYNGDGSYVGSTSIKVTQKVNKANTLTTLAFTKSGSTVNFTATVSAVAPGAGIPSGKVTFYDGTRSLGTINLSGGKAAFSKSNLSGHSIKAVYGGDTNFITSTSAVVRP